MHIALYAIAIGAWSQGLIKASLIHTHYLVRARRPRLTHQPITRLTPRDMRIRLENNRRSRH